MPGDARDLAPIPPALRPSRPPSQASAQMRNGHSTLTLQRPARTRPPRDCLSVDCVARVVNSAANGDQGAWDELVGEFSHMIWGVARAHRLDDADASDVVQATWLLLLENLCRLKDPGRVGAWLTTTARRECLRVLRANGRKVLLGDGPPEPVSLDVAPGEALLADERDRALREGFARLRATDQALLRLLMADPRPRYEEISAALEIPIGSIGPTRQRALERLRRELDGEGTLSLMTA